MSRILLLNQGHTDNIGDQAIDAVLSTFLRSRGFDVTSAPYEEYVEGRIQFAFDRKEILPRTARHMSALMDHWHRTRIRALLERIEGAGNVDAAVIGGGELLAVSHRGFASAFPIWCEELEKRGIPVFITGVSGDFRPGRSAERFAHALRTCAYISVRDMPTERMMRDDYGVDAVYHPDVVFSYTRIFPDTVGQLPRDMSLCIPVHLNAAGYDTLQLADESAYMDYLAAELRSGNTATDRPVIVTSTVSSEDYPEQVAQALVARGLDAHVRTGLELPAFIDLLNRTGFLLSGRMHACILGLQYGCDVHPIPYRAKLAAFASEYDNVSDLDRVSDASYAGLEDLAARLEMR